MFYTQGRMSSILYKDDEWAAEKKVGRKLHNSAQLSLSLMAEQQAEENSKKPFSPC